MIWILGLSILLQLAAAALALRLIRETGRWVAWTMIAAAIALMAARRCITFISLLSGAAPGSGDLSAEMVALAVSVLMLAGVACIGPVFRRTKEAAEKLRASEQQYRDLVETSNDLLWSVDAAGRWTFVNGSATRKIYGFEPEEMLGRAFMDFMTPERARIDLEVFERIKAGEKYFQYETEHLRKDGSPVTLRFNAIVLSDEQGNILGSTGTATDITPQKRAAEALQESEQRFRVLSQAAFEGIVLIDEGLTVDANRAFADMLGYALEEVIGTDARRFVAPGCLEAATQWALAGASTPFETLGLRKDGTAFPVEVRLREVPYQGRLMRVVAVQDIAARKQAEAERQRLQARLLHKQKLESLGVLAGGIAHDFNNLLTGILGNAHLTAENLPEESPACRALAEIARAAERAAMLTRQMLAYAGQGRFEVGVVDLSQQVREIGPLFSSAIPKKVRLELGLSEDLPLVEVDTAQLQQVVMNLVINGAEAIGDSVGAVTVRTGYLEVGLETARVLFAEEKLAPGAYVFLEVSDTGCGMDEATRARIFEPFYSTKFAGRGLGLSAVQGIVRGHRGALRVYSTPGKGSSFKVFLPATLKHALPQERVSPVDLFGEGLVLVVDDEEAVRDFAARALEHYGYRVLTAQGGRRALELFREHRTEIDWVLLDLTMPEMSGEETFRALRDLRPDVKVILSSGYNEVEAIAHFTSVGAAGFIQKPYSPTDLAARLKARGEVS